MKKNKIIRNKEKSRLEFVINIICIILFGIFILFMYLVEYGFLNKLPDELGVILFFSISITILGLMFYLQEYYKKKSNNLEEDYIMPDEYEYTIDNENILKKLINNIRNEGYSLKSKEEGDYKKFVYNKRVMRLVIISSSRYDDKVKEMVSNEIEKCKKYNIDNKSKHKLLQLIVIVDDSYIYVDDFFATELLYADEIKYNNVVAGLVIPFVVDKNNKKVIISGFKTKDSRLLRTFNFQKKIVAKMFENII